MYDVIIVGGSSAGLSAALTLGRSRRKVLIFDDAQPCNRFSKASHGFLTRDGIGPGELLEIAREQLTPYTSVEFRAETVVDITPEADGFSVQTNSGSPYSARKLLLATGIKDVLPAIKGLDDFWGRSVFHCPYCDGWEVRDEALVVIGEAQTTFHQTMLLWNWTSNLTLCTHAEWDVSDEQRALLAKNNIRLIETAISHVDGADEQIHQIVFADGEVLPCKAIFTHPEAQPANAIRHCFGLCDQRTKSGRD